MTSSFNPAAVESQMEIARLMDQIVVHAIGQPAPADVAARSRMIGHVWYSAMTGWVNGWSPIERVYAEIEIAAVADPTIVILNPGAGDAVQAAKTYLTETIRHSLAIGHGTGPTNHFYFLEQ